MSQNHPIVAITGASGAGTTVVKQAFQQIFRRENISAAYVTGECFRRYDRAEMQALITQKQEEGRTLSPYGPEVNRFDLLEELFDSFANTGNGKLRRYISKEEACGESSTPEGRFSDWEALPENADLLFYEGLHGGVVANKWTRRKMSASHNPKVIIERRNNGKNPAKNTGVDVAQHVDLLIGVVPVVNLEWIQKINHDRDTRGFSTEATSRHIVERMQDYIHFIVPQFSMSDINFQRVPIVDTSNPFIAREIPESNECIVVIRFRDPARYDLPRLQELIDGAYMSRPNTMVISGSQLKQAMDVICTPLIQELVER
ncbi:MAG: phosphoribulokinase [Ectothiorhodospiraceae bacterium]|nr:phosphoribulokinase [Ectothiorhodospiraceae bacterium]